MKLLYTKYILGQNSQLFIEAFEKNESNIYEILKELIIIEILLTSSELNAQEIQIAFNDFFMENKKYLPKKYYEFYSNNKKIRLKQTLINLTTSNADHTNGLQTRKELNFRKSGKNTFYKANSALLNFNKFNSLCETFLFMKKYPFISNLYNKIYDDDIKLFCFLCNQEYAKLIWFDSKKDDTLVEALFNICGICKFCIEEQIWKEIRNV